VGETKWIGRPTKFGVHLTPFDTGYPNELRALPAPPNLTVSGPLDQARRVAIVGSRNPVEGARAFAAALAHALAKAGVTVISGGALGIDAAAHRGAMNAGGATWVISGTGCNHVYPPRHDELFASVASSGKSRMIWPFDDNVGPSCATFRSRNGVLVALSEVVIVVQAHFRSGSRNAATWARSLGRALWAVPPLPWPPYVGSFSGCAAELARGAKPLHSIEELFRDLRLPLDHVVEEKSALIPWRRRHQKKADNCTVALPFPLASDALSSDEKLVLSNLSLVPMHLDEILEMAQLNVSSAITALLTLSMKDVVVEGPDGFYRRKSTK
jgi:DNA processing protein